MKCKATIWLSCKDALTIWFITPSATTQTWLCLQMNANNLPNKFTSCKVFFLNETKIWLNLRNKWMASNVKSIGWLKELTNWIKHKLQCLCLIAHSSHLLVILLTIYLEMLLTNMDALCPSKNLKTDIICLVQRKSLLKFKMVDLLSELVAATL